jgi:hypothetical protein
MSQGACGDHPVAFFIARRSLTESDWLRDNAPLKCGALAQ